jgi:oligopeptide transport system permease protein
MTTYIIRRLLWMIPVLFTVALVTFVLMRNAPGGPWDRDPSARQVDPNTQRVLNEYYGLNKPLWRQFVAYSVGDFNKNGKFICGAICGNLGPSYRVRGMTIQHYLFSPPEEKAFWYSRFGYSLRLGLIALVMAIVLASRSVSWPRLNKIPSPIMPAYLLRQWVSPSPILSLLSF